MKLFKDDYKEHWYDQKIGRAITSIMLTFAILFCSALMSNFEITKVSICFAVLTFIFISLQVVFTIRCTAFDKARELSVEEMVAKVKIYKKLANNFFFSRINQTLFKKILS